MNRPHRDRGTSYATAIHEAGHAVAARVLLIPVERVSIVPSGDTLGHCRRAALSFTASDEPTRLDAERFAVMTLAGPIAEQRYTKRRLSADGPSHDYAAVADFALTLWGDERTASAWIRFLVARTKALLKQPGVWPQVVAVADALMTRHELGPADIQRVCDFAMEKVS